MSRTKVTIIPPLWPDLRVAVEPTWKDWPGWIVVNLTVWPLFILDVLF